MTKTLRDINAQIARLEKEAEVIRRREVAEVIAKIKVAIDAYGITAKDLGLKASRTSATRPAAKKRGSPAAGKVAIKYRDGAGNTWTGRGRPPRWLVAAVEAGKKREDFLV